MATIDGYAWTTIADSRVDADSPWDDTLAIDIRDNLENLMRWLGGDYLSTATENHDHDGSNSALIGGASGGSFIAVQPFKGIGQSVRFDTIRFKPQFALISHIVNTSTGAPASVSPFMKTLNQADQSSYSFSSGLLASHGLDGFYEGGFGLDGGASDLNSASVWYDRLMLRSKSGLVHCDGYSGTGSTLNITAPGFQPTLVIITRRATNGDAHMKISDYTSNNAKNMRTGAFVTNAITSLDATGFTLSTNAEVNSSGVTYDYIALKAGSGDGERIAKLTWAGNGVDGRAITGAGFRPQAALIFRTDVTSNTIDSFQTASMRRHGATRFASTTLIDCVQTFDSDGMTIDANVNASGQNYTAFLFLGGVRTNTM